jgi:epsilon-lactone hydrolase
MKPSLCPGLLLAAATSILVAQTPAPTTAAQAPEHDSSYIDQQGTAHVTRVVPVPETISPEARALVARPASDVEQPQTIAERRAGLDRFQALRRVQWSKLFPNQIVDTQMGGVPVRVITPDGMPAENRDKVLLNLHGGGFNGDSGSYSETIPIAGNAKIKVVAVLYRLAPEHPFPAAVDDSVAVYKELLKTYRPDHIAIYGTSAGAIMTGEVAVKLKQLGLPQPAALGIFSGMGDFAHEGDSESLFSLRGLAGHLDPPQGPHDPYYVGSVSPTDPVLSPVFANLHGLPPTLFVTATRDQLLSGTVNLHRAFLRDGVDARLVVFDALQHAFWYDPSLPESIEANRIMAEFLMKQLAR